MRKLILEFEPNEMIKEGLKSTFENVQSYEILETLKIDVEKGTCVDLIECRIKDDVSIHDLKFIGNNEILNVLKSEGNKHTCLVKYQEAEDSKELFKEFDLDLIYTSPNIITSEKITCSVIGDHRNLTRLIELIKTKVGNIVNMRFQKAAYQQHDILSVLTDKQREILLTAQKAGYYDYPKKVNSDRLSQKVNLSKTTLVQHLRKAEARLMANICEGYQPSKQK